MNVVIYHAQPVADLSLTSLIFSTLFAKNICAIRARVHSTCVPVRAPDPHTAHRLMKWLLNMVLYLDSTDSYLAILAGIFSCVAG